MCDLKLRALAADHGLVLTPIELEASPGRKDSGTNTPRPVVCCPRSQSARHSRAKAATRLHEPVKPRATKSAGSCFKVRRCFRDFPASVFSQAASLSKKGSSLLGRSGTVNVGSIVPAFKYFVIVLHDSPVRWRFSRIDCFSQRHPTDMFKSPTWITGLPRLLTAFREGSHGSVLNGNYLPNQLSSAWKPTATTQLRT